MRLLAPREVSALMDKTLALEGPKYVAVLMGKAMVTEKCVYWATGGSVLIDRPYTTFPFAKLVFSTPQSSFSKTYIASSSTRLTGVNDIYDSTNLCSTRKRATVDTFQDLPYYSANTGETSIVPASTYIQFPPAI